MAKGKRGSELENDKRREPTRIGIALSLPFKAFIALLFSILISIIIEWIGMTFIWKNEGVNHSRLMVNQEIQYINDRALKSVYTPLFGIQPKEFFQQIVSTTYKYLNKTGVWNGHQKEKSNIILEYLAAALYIMLVGVIRFSIFIFALPVFALFSVVGAVIGLVEREKRKAGGGRESSLYFEVSRAWILPSIGLSFIIYLAWPNSIDPSFVIIPFALSSGVAFMYMTASFKKYA